MKKKAEEQAKKVSYPTRVLSICTGGLNDVISIPAVGAAKKEGEKKA